MNKHAKQAPSSQKNREICPSYTSNDVKSEASDRGTMLHGLLEKYETKALDSKEAEELDNLDYNSLSMILDYEDSIREGLENIPDAKCTWTEYREFKIDLRSLDIPECDKGTCDLLFLEHWDDGSEVWEEIDFFDYKMGWLEVDDPEENCQIIIYALGLMARFPEVETVRAHVPQPWRDEVGTAIFHRKDMPKLLLRQQTISARVVAQRGKVFHPSLENCGYCANKGNCEALHSFALKTYERLEFPKLEIDLTPDQCNRPEYYGQIFSIAKLLGGYNGWYNQIKDKITNYAIEGGDIDGFDLEERAGGRYLTSLPEAFEVLEEQYDISTIDLISAAGISTKDLEDVIKEHAPKGQKQAFVKEVFDKLTEEGLIARGKSSQYLKELK